MIMRLLADEWSAAVARIGACPFRRVRRVFETLGQAPFRDRPGFALALPAQAPIRATTTGHPCQTKDLSCSRIGACASSAFTRVHSPSKTGVDALMERATGQV